jgi:PadR family transcriptional regulator, regulatory protein PadR
MQRQRKPSKQMHVLIAAMAVQAPDWTYGYDLMKVTGLMSGTMYPLLMRMCEQGLVDSEWREPTKVGRPPRHAYRLTVSGLALARELEGQSSPVIGKRAAPI